MKNSVETVIAKVRVFVSNISSPPFKWRFKRYGFSYFFCNARRCTAFVQQKFESVFLHVKKKHRNNLLFSYYGSIMNWDFVVLSLIYFRTASI